MSFLITTNIIGAMFVHRKALIRLKNSITIDVSLQDVEWDITPVMALPRNTSSKDVPNMVYEIQYIRLQFMGNESSVIRGNDIDHISISFDGETWIKHESYNKGEV